MAFRRTLTNAALPLLVVAALIGVSACAADGPVQSADPAATSGTEGDGVEQSAAPADSGEGSGAASGDALAALLARYADCDAAGSVLGGAIDGLQLDESSTFDADDIECLWAPEQVDAGTKVTAVQISGGANEGAGDVPDAATIALIGGTQVADPAVEAIGGAVYVSVATGDLQTAVTAADVPGLSLQVTQTVLGEAPALAGDTAVPAINALLGIG